MPPTLGALTLAVPASAQAPKHPLDPLSPKEHWVVYDVVQASGHVDPKTRYASVTLHEPPKAEVLAWKPGSPFRREALLTLMRGPKSFRAVVDIAARKVVSWSEIPGIQPNLLDSEEEAVNTLVKENADMIAAFRRHGIVDLATVDCYGESPGYFATPEEEGRRLVRAGCMDHHGVFAAEGHPIEGLWAVVDVHELKVLRVIDTGVVPIASGGVSYDEESLGRLRDLPTPILVNQPLGPSFALDGHEVSWQKWKFHFRVDPRRGIVLSTVRYVDGERVRAVMYQGSLSEIFVPYMDPGEGWYYLTFLDGGEYSAHGLANPLERDADCPENAVYFDAVVASDRGIPEPRPRSACLFERSGGEVAWRHATTGPAATVESRQRRDLVLRMIATIGNYDYVFDWIFQQDGTLRVSVGATGVVAVKGVVSRRAPTGAGPNGEPRDDAYGHLVAENTVAINHDHFFCFRLDLDVDGPRNSFVIDRIKTKRLPDTSLRKSIWVVEPGVAHAEREAQLHMSMEEPAVWRVINPSVHGPLGYPVGYEIRPEHNAKALLAPDDPPQRRAGFTEHALWVTPYKPDELYAAGDYPTQSHGGDGLPAWTAANRAIEDTDIVVWYTLGVHHTVRAEDWPVMPTAWHSFEIRPFDFFERNPALDLPKKP
jgi:primary-amine oxidase